MMIICYMKAIVLGQGQKMTGLCPYKNWKLWEHMHLSDLLLHPKRVGDVTHGVGKS